MKEPRYDVYTGFSAKVFCEVAFATGAVFHVILKLLLCKTILGCVSIVTRRTKYGAKVQNHLRPYEKKVYVKP